MAAEVGVTINLKRFEVQTGGDADPNGLYLVNGSEWHHLIAGQVVWAENPPQSVEQGTDPEAWAKQKAAEANK